MCFIYKTSQKKVPDRFWVIYPSNLHRFTFLPSLFKLAYFKDSRMVTEGSKITEMLKTQYETVYSKPDEESSVSNPQEFFSQNEAEEQFNSIISDRHDIMEDLDSLSYKSSAGLDGVSSVLLKKGKRSLADPLLIVFRSFLHTGVIPSILKEDFVVPVHKGGARSVPANFRPGSLTFHIIKTMERIIRKSMINHLEVHKKLSESETTGLAYHNC